MQPKILADDMSETTTRHETRRRGLAAMLLLLCCLTAEAQRKITVLDVETLQPIEGVTVRVDSCQAVITDRQGVVTVAERFDSISFSHVLYERERLAFAEVGDTMQMFPSAMMLPEVQVVSVSPELLSSIKEGIAQIVAAQPPQPLARFDMARLLDRRWRRDQKHLKQAEKIIEEYDKK